MLTREKDNITDADIVEETTTTAEKDLLAEFEETIEVFEDEEKERTPPSQQEPEQPAIKLSPFAQNEAKKVISQSAEKAVERLLGSLNKGIANLCAVILEKEATLFLPPENEVKELSKDLAVLMPTLKIGKGTGVAISFANSYVPVATAIIVASKERKNIDKKETLVTVKK